MSSKYKHLSPIEFLDAMEQGVEQFPHLMKCRQCRKDLEGFHGVVALLRRIWHPGPLELPAAHIVLANAQQRRVMKGGLFSATVGWFVLLVIASGLVCVSSILMPQISEQVASVHAGVGTAGVLALFMILLGLTVSPVVVLLGEPGIVERSLGR